MLPSPESTTAGEATRVDAIAARIEELDARLRAAEIATGDEKTAKELRKAVEAISKHDPKLDERLTNRVDVLADRLNTLATTVSTTAAALAGKDGEFVGLRRELERGHAKVEALDAEVRRTAGPKEIDELRRAVAALAAERPEQAGDKRVAQLSGKLDVLAERVDTLATTIATTASGLAGREGDISVLRRRLDEDVAQLTQAVRELRQAGGQDELASQVHTLSGVVTPPAHDLVRRQHETAELRALVDDGNARLDSAVAKLRHALGAAVTRIDGLESSSGAEALGALQREVAEVGQRVEELSARLEALGGTVEETVAANAEKEQVIASLGRRFEHASASVEALVRDLSEALATMPRAAGESPAVGAELADLEGRIADLTERLTSITRDRGEAAVELARTKERWFSELSALDTRFDELAARVDSLDRSRGVSTTAVPEA